MPLQLEIVTPAGRALERTADSVVLPTTLGEIGILPGHIPLSTLVEAGELRVLEGTSREIFVVGNGFALIENDRVAVLTDSAVNEASIDEQTVEQARRRAEEALAQNGELDPAEVEKLESIVRFSVAQLIVRKTKR
jgi:F-type H+-transporting ATPase subunit epsilon